MPITRVVKYEAELDKEFAEWICTVPGGDKIRQCIQCGTCTGSCPMSVYMDHGPRRIIAMARAGFKDEVLASKTIWLCSSCYSCSVRCPADIKITDLMYSLKRRSFEENKGSREIAKVLAEQFTAFIRRFGRVNEGLVASLTFMRTNPLQALGLSSMGIRLLKAGRMPLAPHGIKRIDELRKIMDAAKEGSK